MRGSVGGGRPRVWPVEDRQWRRGVRVLGVVAALVALAGTAPDVTGPAAAALLAAGLLLWLVELFAAPSNPAVELGLLVVVGGCGGALNGIAADSAGFLFAYFAAAALGIRFALRDGTTGTVAVLTVLAIGIVAGDRPHPVTSLTTSLLGVAFAFAVASAARNARLAHARAEALLHEVEGTRALQVQAAALGERARLAREIHDILAHSLSGQVMALEAARLLAVRTGADHRLAEEIDRAHRLARGGLVETRGAIAALRGDTLPGPDLLGELVERARADQGIRAELHVTGQPRRLGPEAGLTLYRTAQEALTNTAKYAGRGATAALALTWDEEEVTLSITDVRSEKVAVPASSELSGGYGLTGLRERAELAGGSLTAGPTGDGYVVRLTVPYTAERSA